MYASFVDASKAFNRVKFVTLFELLLAKHICPTIARLLSFLYTSQQRGIKVVWGSITSIQCKQWSEAGRCSFHHDFLISTSMNYYVD